MAQKKVDVLLVGAGVMSATLGSLLSQLDPALKIAMVERLSKVAQESTHSLNNAGTGHAALCDGADVLYERVGYELPKALKVGDRLQLLAAGAYTTTYASIGFNGCSQVAFGTRMSTLPSELSVA